ncbi:MAG TPA: M18 family aminopeptidase [Halanaerobiaceae bacterium]|nr:M18 family aminopeptidase [Bacillota bacterium]HHU93216.1 M18 family aminopeptidase [Halanaerobiaceae bacterium]HOA40904.1 M18 family aminopeptidase [Halanaerobiales bacterium]HPZ62510.1 M18 family aminopeptidase [Halanaerobiales bacterium]HQD03729.1 M18 family aminopeptidase [Halanaerobiales bacterium]
MIKINREIVNDLLDFIYKSPTAFQVADNLNNILRDNGFIELEETEEWSLEKNKKYFVRKNDSALIAFRTGKEDPARAGFRIIAAHSDSPGLKIKPAPELIEAGQYLKLNTEVYGGPILNTWLDRPLAIAGRISYQGDNPLFPESKLININKALALIPNLAIHLNPEVNKGVELNRQKELLPLIKMMEEELEKDNYLLSLISAESGIPTGRILDFELYLYEYEKGTVCGVNEEFISSARLDNLAMVHAGLNSLLRAEEHDSTQVLVVFDNEEVGSMTKQGADSPFLANSLERIALAYSYSRENYFRSLANSFMISADMAHAVHPNYPEKHDPSNKNYLNQGPVIKLSANQSYTSDSNSVAVCKELCHRAGIPYQIFVNRSDQRGGSTIGPVSASQLNIRSVDIGNPLLAMHSIREMAGVKDHYYMISLFTEFYNV